MSKGFIAGMAATVLAGIVGAYFFVILGLMPANADSKPPALERWAAHKSLNAAVSRQMPKGPPPLTPTEENLSAGLKVYAVNCAVCHGAYDGKASNIAKGLYQHAPQLAKHGVTDDEEGETYWKVDHGIRMTGMPGFSSTLSQDQIWQVTLFLKHMDNLTPKAKKGWEALPSQG